MQVLYFLEDIRIPVVDQFMLLVTQLGEVTAFLVTALILFWCVEKRHGYYLLAVGFLGTLANQFMKLVFRVPRPWVLDESFTILEQAREAASGYSFPSGHAQSAVGTFGLLAYTVKKRWIRILALVIAVLVPFSRMYIGVHTPADVLVSAVLAIILILVLKPVVLDYDGKYIPVLLCLMTAAAAGFMSYVYLYQFPEDIDPHNLASGIKNAHTLLGALLGFLIVYFVDAKWLHFSTSAVWWAQVLIIAGGLALVLLVKSGLKVPLNLLFGESIGRTARYFLIVIVAGIVWPLTFPFFQRFSKK